MYGIILESVKTAIIESFGEEIWNEILNDLSIDHIDINLYQVYPDELVSNILSCK